MILIGSRICSAGELAVLDLMSLPRSTTVGDRTFGSVGWPRNYLLNGPLKGKMIENHEKPSKYQATLSLFLPSRLSYSSKKQLLQGKGITPSIFIDPKKSILGGKEMVLEKAIKILSKK